MIWGSRFRVEKLVQFKRVYTHLECVVIVEQVCCAFVCVEVVVTHMHAYAHTYTHARTHPQTNTRTYTFMYVSVEALVHVRRL